MPSERDQNRTDQIRALAAQRATSQRAGPQKRPAPPTSGGSQKRRTVEPGCGSRPSGIGSSRTQPTVLDRASDQPTRSQTRAPAPPPPAPVSEGVFTRAGRSAQEREERASSDPSSAPIFRPKWRVTEKSSVLDEQTAVDLASSLMTPEDDWIFAKMPYQRLYRLGLRAAGQASAISVEMSRRVEAYRNRLLVLTAEVKELTGKLSASKAIVEQLQQAEVVLQGKLREKEHSLQGKDEFLFEKNNAIIEQSKEISRLNLEVEKLREQLAQAPEQAVLAFKASEDYVGGLVDAYAACWEDAAALCQEQGQAALADLMTARARSYHSVADEGETVAEHDGALPEGGPVIPDPGTEADRADAPAQ